MNSAPPFDLVGLGLLVAGLCLALVIVVIVIVVRRLR